MAEFEAGQPANSDAARLLAAIRFAADKHRQGRRKDEESSPYINHPIAVAEVLADVGGVTDLVTLQAAILHDTIEDTKTTSEELEELFGAEVRRVVEEVTDKKSLPKDVRKSTQIKSAPNLSHRGKLVRIADKICNVIDLTDTPPPGWPAERRRENLEWTAKVVEGCRGVNEALEARYDEVLGAGRARMAGG
jgi:guanosine-3',5'-bis(diphosphate) 3'-pyrophosphohydrolase